MKNKLIIMVLISFFLNVSYAQNLNQKYSIVLWNKNFKSIEHVTTLETLGFLPVFQNNRDEITIGDNKIILESYLDIQVLENNNNSMKVLLKFKNNKKEYIKELILENKQIKDLEDFKIKIEIK